MLKRNLLHIIILLILGTLVSCSVRRNTGATRFYHSFTTRYNIYFNANENYKEQLKVMERDYEDNFTDLLFMHPAEAYADEKSPQPTGSFDRTIEKCQKAIQLHSIKKRPKRNSKKMDNPKYRAYMKRDEYNPFIHKAWSLMGKAQYYKGEFLEAAATFLYIARHFTWMPDLVAESKLWQARCYIALGWFYEAEDILLKINNDNLPESQLNTFAAVNANYLIRKGEYSKAIPFLQTAIKAVESKPQRIRLTFLLGQLYAETNEPTKAYETYEKVIKMSPTYRTEFNARISQTEVFSGSDIEKEVKKLKRMASKGRNKEFLDQVYYAIGNLYISHNDTLNAIENYRLAASKSTRNGIEKAVSQVALGNLHFERREYVDAQPCYAEAIPLLKEDYPNYKLLSKRSAVLDELVVYAENVELQDSLQTLAAMSEPERNKAIQKIIDDLIKKEEEEAEAQRREEYLAQQQGPQFNSNNAAKQNMTMLSNDKSWYFYNKPMVSAGKAEFQRTWGSRKLEDDWRRRNKSGFSMDDFAQKNEEVTYDDIDEDVAELSPEEAALDSMRRADASDPHKIEYYLQQLPLTPEAITTSNEVIADGFFNMGIILKNKLEDYPAAIANFNTLEERFPENPYRLEIYYNMYLMYMRDGDTQTANIYRDKIRTLFPQSPYAQAMADPNYLNNLRRLHTEQDSIYEATYAAYLDNKNSEVHANTQYMEQKYPLSAIMPKFLFLNALAYIGDKQYDQFQSSLKELLKRFPQADVSPLATTMLKGLAQGRQVAESSENMRGMIWKTRLTNDSTLLASNDTTQAGFTQNLNAPHVLLLVYATDSVSSNQLLFDVAKHNFTNFVVKDFELEIMTFNEISMLVVRGFNNFGELSHYRQLLDSSDTFRYPSGVRPIMISDDNFQKLLEGYSFEEYFLFLENNPQTTESYEER